MSVVAEPERIFVFADGKLVDSYLPPISVPAVEVRAGAVVHLPISDRRALIERVECGTDSQHRPRRWFHHSTGVYGTSPGTTVLVSPDCGGGAR